MKHHARHLVLVCSLLSAFSGGARSAALTTPPATPEHAAALFEDVSWEWGLHAQHRQQRESLAGLSETLGAGACVLDFNRDGWMDLLLVGGSGQRRAFGAPAWWQAARGHRLYRNAAATGFIDVTADSGLEPSWGMGCASADWDSDGDEDLLITAYNNTLLYRNEGNGRFTALRKTGISPRGWATSASVADYDGDGRLDIYIAYFIDYRRGQPTFEAGAGFKPELAPDFNPALYNAQPNRLYRNLGELQFEEVAASAGVTNSAGRSLQGLWTDLNADDAADLVVLNARGSPAVIYFNDLQGGFSAADGRWKFSSGEGLHGAGRLAGSHSRPALLVATTGVAEALSIGSRADTAPLNPWDMGLARDVDLALSGWGVATGDFDNNGTLDIVTANGAAGPDPDAPGQPLGQANMIYRGQTDGSFIAGILAPALESSRGVISLDANNDGALDLLVTNNNNAPQLLLNRRREQGRRREQSHWLGLAFQDRNGNPLTHGVNVTVSGDGWALSRRLSDRQGFLSAGEPRVHIGLGTRSAVEELRVRWPDGSGARFHQPPVDGYLTLRQGQPLPQRSTADPGRLNAELQQQRRFYRRFGLLYIHLLVHAGPAASPIRFLRHITQASVDALATAIQALPTRPRSDWFFLLARGIESSDPGVQGHALKVLQRWELEASVRYLLPLLADADAGIQCRTAQVFEAFFREEEAVMQRKYLAVPVLVRLLRHGNASVQICAMQALAEAERFRGLHPLLELSSSTNADVARQALKTLGRIRQREAVPALQALAATLAEDSQLWPELNWTLAQLTTNTLARDQGQDRSAGYTPPASLLTATQRAQVSRLRRQFGSPAPGSERALLSELQTLEDGQVWRAFLDTVPLATDRGKRLLLKNMQHRNAEVVALVTEHSAIPGSDPRYAQSLWRLLLSPNYPRPARLALAWELGRHDAHRLIGLLPEMAHNL